VRNALAALAAAVALGLAASPAVAHRATLRGVVLNTTCPGPCASPSNPPRYTGPGLTVRVRSIRSGDLVATRHPTDGAFALSLRLGPYRVSADVAGACWRGSRRRVRLDSGGDRVRLTVENVCIV
jgi:hypothetical protein